MDIIEFLTQVNFPVNIIKNDIIKKPEENTLNDDKYFKV